MIKKMLIVAVGLVLSMSVFAQTQSIRISSNNGRVRLSVNGEEINISEDGIVIEQPKKEVKVPPKKKIGVIPIYGKDKKSKRDSIDKSFNCKNLEAFSIFMRSGIIWSKDLDKVKRWLNSRIKEYGILYIMNASRGIDVREFKDLDDDRKAYFFMSHIDGYISIIKGQIKVIVGSKAYYLPAPAIKEIKEVIRKNY